MIIWKFELEITTTQKLMLPAGAKLLSVHSQNGGVLCLWAMVDPNEQYEPRIVEIVGTGNPMQLRTSEPELKSSGIMGQSSARIERKFIGTVVINPGVWHVFERLN